MADTNRNPWFALVRDSAIVAGVAGAWVIANALGDLEAQLARAGAKDEHLAVLIDRNVKAIDRNAEAIDRNAEAIDRNAVAIGELKESVASLTGQYAEHTRKHEELAGR